MTLNYSNRRWRVVDSGDRCDNERKSYRKHIEKDAALERRFQPVVIEEPSAVQTISMLKGLRSRYEEFHKVEITDAAIEAAVQLSERYLNDRYLPDKAD